MEPLLIEINGENACLTLEFLARPYSGGDSWSRDCIAIAVRARHPGFQAAFHQELYLWELEPFYQGLKKLYTDLKGAIGLHSMNGFLELTTSMDIRGQLLWDVELSHPVGNGDEARLRFEMHADQSYLPALLAQIEAVKEHYKNG